jgi:hypothetical protein
MSAALSSILLAHIFNHLDRPSGKKKAAGTRLVPAAN